MNHKALLIGTLALALSACGSKDEPTPVKPQPKPAGQEQVDPKDPKDKPKDQEGTNPQEPKDKPKEEEPKTPTKPSAYAFATRLHAQLKVSPEQWARGFDLASLYEDGNVQPFTAEYLSSYLSFHTSETDGSLPYTLTAEELKDLQIVDLRYRAPYVQFYTSYKGVRSQQMSSISLPLQSYYAQLITIDPAFAPEHYAYGTARHLDLYLGHLLIYDRARYAVSLESNGAQTQSAVAIGFNVSVRLKADERELTQLSLNASPFRALSHLKDELKIYATYELKEYMKRHLKGLQADAGDIMNRIQHIDTRVWAKHLTLNLAGKDLVWEEGSAMPSPTTLADAHLYLSAPRFQLLGAQLRDGDLYLRLQLVSVNEQSVDGLIYDVPVRKVI